MSGFHFDDNNLVKLEIEDQEFSYRITPENEKRGKLIGDYAQQVGADVKAGKYTEQEGTQKILDKTVETLNIMLGEGAVQKIFKNREVNLFDLMAMMDYITGEIRKFSNAKFNKYNKRPSNNIKKKKRK